MNDKQIAAMDAALSDMLTIPDVEMLKRANDPRNEFAFFYNNPCPECGAEMRREGRCWRCPCCGAGGCSL